MDVAMIEGIGIDGTRKTTAMLLMAMLLFGSMSAVAFAGTYRYEIWVKTTDQYEAGTDANIFLRMYGMKGTSGEYRLNKYISGNAFERGDKNHCTLKLTADIGVVYKIKLRSDGKYGGSDWRLSYLKIKGAGKTTKFDFYKWIHKKSYEKTCSDFGLAKKGAAMEETLHVPKAIVLDAVNGAAAAQPYKVTIHDEETYAIARKESSKSSVRASGEWKSPESLFGQMSSSVQTEYEKAISTDRSQASKVVTDIVPTTHDYQAEPGTCLVVVSTWAFRYKRQDLQDWLGASYAARWLEAAQQVTGVSTIEFKAGTRRTASDWQDVAWAVYDALGGWAYGQLVRKLQSKGMLDRSVPSTMPACPYAD